jgi:UDPglucose 6-dehydrogenase
MARTFEPRNCSWEEPSQSCSILIVVESSVEIVKSPYEAVAGAAAVVIATEWDCFRCDQMDYRKVFDLMSKPAFIFDGRLIVEEVYLRELGFNVEIIGKGKARAVSLR